MLQSPLNLPLAQPIPPILQHKFLLGHPPRDILQHNLMVKERPQRALP